MKDGLIIFIVNIIFWGGLFYLIPRTNCYYEMNNFKMYTVTSYYHGSIIGVDCRRVDYPGQMYVNNKTGVVSVTSESICAEYKDGEKIK